MEDKCKVGWNLGHWPYVTHCVLPKGHKGDHEDKNGYRRAAGRGQDDE